MLKELLNFIAHRQVYDKNQLVQPRSTCPKTDIFLIKFLEENMLWVLIRSPSPSASYVNPQYVFLVKNKKNKTKKKHNLATLLSLFACVEVLWPSQPNGVMPSAVSLPNHTFTGQA